MPKPTSFKAQLVRGLRKIFHHYRNLPNNEQEAYLIQVSEALTRAKIDDGQLRRFLMRMDADKDE